MKFAIHLGAKTLDLKDGGKTRVRVVRSNDINADHALARRIQAAEEIVDAARALIRDGQVNADGSFTYWPAPRVGFDAIVRLKSALQREGGRG